jgi:hypothetical protein
MANASGSNSYAFGFTASASGDYSMTFGKGTKATHEDQFVFGQYNLDNQDYLFEIGNGTDDNNRSDAFYLTKGGNGWFRGQIVANNSITATNIELTNSTPYIDFHFNRTSADYTSRIIEKSSGLLTLEGGITVTKDITCNGTINVRNIHRDVHTVYSNGSSGYVGFCKIVIKSNYANSGFRFRVIQRAHAGADIAVCFTNNNNLEPAISKLYVYGDLDTVKIVKSTTSTWIIYVKKSEAWDQIDVVDYWIPNYMHSKINLTWEDIFSASDPGGTAGVVKNS